MLLDENLVQSAHFIATNIYQPLTYCLSAAHLAPFYLREHSKRILRGALYNDSKFLADINVMDYSLVVGFDSKKNELVIGIVGAQSPLTSLSLPNASCRLHQDIHMGQEIGKLGEGNCIFGWIWQG